MGFSRVPGLFTIGHSTHSTERLCELLRQHAIEAVVDVRSTPNSRYSPHFNRERLGVDLRGTCRYAWMGDVLGGRPPSPEFYDETGHVLYGPLSRTAEFAAGLDRIETASRRYRVALLCAEGEPAGCHRHLLIAPSLALRGFPLDAIQHILPDGGLRPDAEMARQAGLIEDVWRSPLSVLPEPALSPSSSA